MAMPSTGDYVDLHELAKGWKAAIARAKDPATRYVVLIGHSNDESHRSFSYCHIYFTDTKRESKMIVEIYRFTQQHRSERLSKLPRPYWKPIPRQLL